MLECGSRRPRQRGESLSGAPPRTLPARPLLLASGVPLNQFELRFLDRQKALVLARRVFARDVANAMTEAKSARPTHTLELWQETRLVDRLERPFSQRTMSR